MVTTNGFNFEIDPGIASDIGSFGDIGAGAGAAGAAAGGGGLNMATIQQLLGQAGGLGGILGGGQGGEDELLKLLGQIDPQPLQANFNTNIQPQANLGGTR